MAQTNDFDRLVASGQIAVQPLYITSDEAFPASISGDLAEYVERHGTRSVTVIWHEDEAAFQVRAHRHEYDGAITEARRLAGKGA